MKLISHNIFIIRLSPLSGEQRRSTIGNFRLERFSLDCQKSICSRCSDDINDTSTTSRRCNYRSFCHGILGRLRIDSGHESSSVRCAIIIRISTSFTFYHTKSIRMWAPAAERTNSIVVNNGDCTEIVFNLCASSTFVPPSPENPWREYFRQFGFGPANDSRRVRTHRQHGNNKRFHICGRLIASRIKFAHINTNRSRSRAAATSTAVPGASRRRPEKVCADDRRDARNIVCPNLSQKDNHTRNICRLFYERSALANKRTRIVPHDVPFGNV